MCTSSNKRMFNTTMLLVCFVLLLVCQKCPAQWVVEDEGCRTPDRGVGSCVPIKECTPILNLIKTSPKPLSFEIQNALREYTCGFEGRNVKVCCPPKPITIGNPNTNTDLPPDVSSHKNFKLLPHNCGRLEENDRIINGDNATLMEFPWMALLSYQTKKGPEFKCGGTIINRNYILTAAHCITNLKDSLAGVRIGEHNIPTEVDCEIQENGSNKCAPPVQDLRIEEIIPHPNYSKEDYSHDIGLLRVQRMNLSVDNAKPICLPTAELRTANLENKKVIVTGWGVTETGRNSPNLQKVKLPVVSNEECATTYKKNAQITKRQICAGGKDNKDSCPGDSGGPMQSVAFHNENTRYVQYGVVSFGPRICGINGLPGVYSRISYYMDWILDNMKN